MKKALTLLTALCLLLGLGVTAYAADSVYVADEADLLTAEEESVLAQKMAETAERLDCGIYLVTVDTYFYHGGSPQEAAEALYVQQTMYGGVPKDGILLMLSMADRDYSLITYGEYAADVFDDETMWDMEDDFLYYFRQNDWYGGFRQYVDDAAEELTDYYEDAVERYGRGYESYYEPGVPDIVYRFGRVDSELWLVVLFGSMAVALIICLVMKSALGNARKATNANAYIPQGGVDLRVKQDLFTHTTTRVIHHPKSNGGGGSGGGGGFRGHSGKF